MTWLSAGTTLARCVASWVGVRSWRVPLGWGAELYAGDLGIR